MNAVVNTGLKGFKQSWILVMQTIKLMYPPVAKQMSSFACRSLILSAHATIGNMHSYKASHNTFTLHIEAENFGL